MGLRRLLGLGDRPRPGDVLIVGRDTHQLEDDARIRHAANRIEILLARQSRLLTDDRNSEMVDALLDLRNTLRPSASGAEVLRELPPIGPRTEERTS